MEIERFYLDDTHPAVRRMLVERWRSMTAVEKCAIVSSASRALHRAHLAGLRLRHPEADAREIEIRSAMQRLGREKAARIVGLFAPPRAE